MSDKNLTVGKINFNSTQKVASNNILDKFISNCVSVNLPNTWAGWDSWIADKWYYPKYIPAHDSNPIITYNQIEHNIFPKYDVYYTNDDQVLTIDFALSGYKKSDLQVEFNPETRKLKVETKIQNTPKDSDDINEYPGRRYTTQNIAKRYFSQFFNIGLYFEPESVSFKDGLLKIVFRKIVPIEKQPTILNIT